MTGSSQAHGPDDPDPAPPSLAGTSEQVAALVAAEVTAGERVPVEEANALLQGGDDPAPEASAPGATDRSAGSEPDGRA